MSSFYLVRHGDTDYVGRAIAGRMPGVSLNERGRAQAANLPGVFADILLHRLLVSPLERTMQTAQPLAQATGVTIESEAALLEIEFGQWNDQTLEHLETTAGWQQFNHLRSATRAPGGEMMIEAQLRVVTLMQKLHDATPDAVVALVTHADVIKLATLYYMGAPIDFIQRLEIDPASVTRIDLSSERPTIHYMNQLVPRTAR